MDDDAQDIDENFALAQLLLNNIVFCNERAYVDLNGDTEKATTVIFMNCNDVFAWACADGEELPNDEIIPLFQMWDQHKGYGQIRWVCIKRNEKPQSPIVKMMKEAGAWDDVMEALPENTYTAYLRKQRLTQ